MSLAALPFSSRKGDQEAVEAEQRFEAELEKTVEPFVRFARDPGPFGLNAAGAQQEAGMAALQRGLDAKIRKREAEKQAAVEREEATLREVAAMRQAVEGARAADRRAEDAEARERRGESRQRKALSIIVVSLVVTTASTSVAIFG